MHPDGATSPVAAAEPGQGTDGATTTAGLYEPPRRWRTAERIGEVVERLGFAGAPQIEAAVREGRARGVRTGEILVESGALTRDQLARALAEHFGVDYVDLNVFRVDVAASALVPPAAARRYHAVPIGFVDDRTLRVAMADPQDVEAIDDLTMHTGYALRVAVATPEGIDATIARTERLEHGLTEVVDEPEPEVDPSAIVGHEGDAPVVKLVNSIVAQAIEQRASDVHFDPEGRELVVRLRVDGVLTADTRIPARLAPAVVSRLKIMSNLDIAERRLPQDGRAALQVDGRAVDLRAVTVPTVEGESVVVRILDKGRGAMDLDATGIVGADRERLERALRMPSGAVLVTGPTGSGKTTTLYGALGVLHDGRRGMVTIEDPVEYRIAGIKQVQVHPRAGLSFSRGLRALLRADPDVIMVGEIRDRDTAQLATEAALTGHLVLSTLHTRDAAGAITRLVEMGIEPFLVASAVTCVVAQRLLRRLCPHCRKAVRLPADALRDYGYAEREPLEAFEAVGCAECGSEGYHGRIGIYEVMTVSEAVRLAIIERRPSGDIHALVTGEGMRPLREAGLEKVREGITSMAEVARVLG